MRLKETLSDLVLWEVAALIHFAIALLHVSHALSLLHNCHCVFLEFPLRLFVGPLQLCLDDFHVCLLSLFEVTSDHEVGVNQRGIRGDRLWLLLR